MTISFDSNGFLILLGVVVLIILIMSIRKMGRNRQEDGEVSAAVLPSGITTGVIHAQALNAQTAAAITAAVKEYRLNYEPFLPICEQVKSNL